MKKTIFIITILTLLSATPSFAQSYGGLNFKKVNPGTATTMPSKSLEKKIITTKINDDADAPAAKDDEDTEKSILVSYSNFAIDKSITGRISCGVTFSIENNTPYRLSKFSADLDWTGIHTSLNFSSVEANKADYVRYRLLGNGCYTMSETPEITTFRCRLSTPKKDLKKMSFDDEDEDEDNDENKEEDDDENSSITTQQMITQEQCKAIVKWRPPHQE